MSMIKWNKYKQGTGFTSKNGVRLPFKYEFDKLNNSENHGDQDIILSSILSLSFPWNIIAVKTVNPSLLLNFNVILYDPETRKLYGEIKRNFVIFDDVVTTGWTVRACLIDALKSGYELERFVCIVDRQSEYKGRGRTIIRTYSVKNVIDHHYA